MRNLSVGPRPTWRHGHYLRLRFRPGKHWQSQWHTRAVEIRSVVRRDSRAPRGVAAMIALGVLACVALVGLSVMRASLAEQRVSPMRQAEDQARWLAEAALERGAARLVDQPEYQGETWTPDMKDASAVIEVIETAPRNEHRRVLRVRAVLALDDVYRAQVEKQVELTLATISQKSS